MIVEIIEFFLKIVSLDGRDETILLPDEAIFEFDAELRKPRVATNTPTKTAGGAGQKPETVKCEP